MMGVFDWVKEAGAVAAALAAVGGFLLGAWWFIRKVVRIADAVEQLLPNGGKSLADKVNSMQELLKQHIAECRQGGQP